jgi:hypothetical protein
MSAPKGKVVVRITIPAELFGRFKEYYPDSWDTHSVITKLLRQHLSDLDRAAANGLLPLTQVGGRSGSHERDTSRRSAST